MNPYITVASCIWSGTSTASITQFQQLMTVAAEVSRLQEDTASQDFIWGNYTECYLNLHCTEGNPDMTLKALYKLPHLS